MTENVYCNIEINDATRTLVDRFIKYSDEKGIQLYIIKQPLVEEGRYDYCYDNSAVVLIPKHKILIINYGQKMAEFNDFVEDYIEDLGHLSDKYNYKKVLGRPREWRDLIVSIGSLAEIHSIDDYLLTGMDERKVDLLISLLIGSINDIDSVGGECPNTLLDKIKKKIVLFDGMQSRFIYEAIPDKVIKVQGLAGTGKTELLLHKVKKTYMEEKNSRIAFTCFNKVLAEDMKNRIPQFFNYMKVDEQIEWWERLFVFPSWGSQSNPLSGMYAYICAQYNLEFRRYSRGNNFDAVCKDALLQLKNKREIIPCFDYVYIDESQDFTQAFFDLCEVVAKKQIYVAGDIFQNVFDTNIKPAIDCHYSLNKCYRTDPRTLMLAHAIGMGLYEKPVLRWLEDEEWKACGYKIKRENEYAFLNRAKIRRFEDLENEDYQSIVIKPAADYVEEIIKCIEQIIHQNATVQPDDVAIVFLSNNSINYELSDRLLYLIDKKFGWEACQGYITKTKIKDKVFISNVNNIKGLEFPFVICVCTEKITDSIKQRNSIYMILTRSFLNSYLIINEENEKFIQIYQNAIKSIEETRKIVVKEPSDEEKKQQAELIRIEMSRVGKSIEDIIDEECDLHPECTYEVRKKLYKIIPTLLGDAEGMDSVVDLTNQMLDVILGNKI